MKRSRTQRIRDTLLRHRADAPRFDSSDARRVAVRARRRQARNVVVGIAGAAAVIGGARGNRRTRASESTSYRSRPAHLGADDGGDTRGRPPRAPNRSLSRPAPTGCPVSDVVGRRRTWSPSRKAGRCSMATSSAKHPDADENARLQYAVLVDAIFADACEGSEGELAEVGPERR